MYLKQRKSIHNKQTHDNLPRYDSGKPMFPWESKTGEFDPDAPYYPEDPFKLPPQPVQKEDTENFNVLIRGEWDKFMRKTHNWPGADNLFKPTVSPSAVTTSASTDDEKSPKNSVNHPYNFMSSSVPVVQMGMSDINNAHQMMNNQPSALDILNGAKQSEYNMGGYTYRRYDDIGANGLLSEQKRNAVMGTLSATANGIAVGASKGGLIGGIIGGVVGLGGGLIASTVGRNKLKNNIFNAKMLKNRLNIGGHASAETAMRQNNYYSKYGMGNMGTVFG